MIKLIIVALAVLALVEVASKEPDGLDQSVVN